MDEIPPNLSVLIHSTSGPTRVLLIDPVDDEADQIVSALTEHLDNQRVTRVRSLAEAFELELDDFSVAICTMQVQDATGLQVIEELLLLRPELPIIILTDSHCTTDAVNAMREGAYDYVVKNDGFAITLPAIIEKNLALYQVKQENARLQIQLTATLGQLRTRNEQLQGLVKELRAIAATDALTGIANRRAVTQILDQHFAHAMRHDGDLALIAIDLDGFKNLNDSAGHPAGDRVLMQVARVLTANARASDTAGRLGGDEFIVVLPNSDAEEAASVARRIQQDFAVVYDDLSDRLMYSGTVTMSVGIATRKQTGSDAATAAELLAAADRSLYRAKDAGRSCIVIGTQPV